MYSDLLNEILTLVVVDASSLPDNLYSTAIRAIINAGFGTVVRAENNTEVNGYQIPQLTEEQILSIYNAVVTGRIVVISDKNDMMHFVVNQVDSVSDSICVCVMYFDIMVLSYHDDGTIDYKLIGGGTVET